MLRNLSQRGLVAVGFLIALLPLLGFWLTGLTDLDEGYYGAIVAEMNRRGEWITPYYNGSPWFEKPILLYWIAKPFVALFGPIWGARMGVVVCAMLLYALIYRFVRKHYGDYAGLGTMLVAATSLILIVSGRMLITDGPLALAFLLCLTGIYEGLKGEKQGWPIAGIGLGISVLAKGPVGLVLIGLLVAWTAWKQPADRKVLAKATPLVLLIAFAIASTWYVPCYLANRDTFVQKFLIEQNLNRFKGGDLAHNAGGFFFYVPILLLGFAPWWWHLRKAWGDLNTRPELRLFARWAVLVFVFFTISSAKLPHYILPMIPALAVVVGVHLFAAPTIQKGQVIDSITPDLLRRPAMLAAGFFVLVNAGLLYTYSAMGSRELHDLVRSVKGQKLGVFQLTRRNKSLGTGTLKLQETSQPSIGFYLDDTYDDLETWEDLDRSAAKFILTRPNRITDDDAALHRLVVKQKSENYTLFERTDISR